MTSLRRIAFPAMAFLLMQLAASAQNYKQTNLVSSVSGVAPVTDASLSNAWGLTRGSSTPWWVSDNGSGVSTLYTGTGTKVALTVTIPAAVPGKIGSPTGVIFNGSSTDFLLAPSTPAHFIFSTIDGMIVGWNNPTAGAMPVVKTTDHSVYTGLTSAVANGHRYLYAANFAKGRVDVYDSAFHRVWFDNEHDSAASADEMGDDRGDEDRSEQAFTDRRLPPNFDPFNVQAIGNDIVVTYALHMPGNPFETDGPGLGRVDIYSATGRLLLRLQHGDWLNAPWGVALAPLDFGTYSHDLLVAQFAGGGMTESSGWIAAYDLATGRFVGVLKDASGNPLSINGVWGISFGNAGADTSTSTPNYDTAGAPAAEMYFTAGPNHGSEGLFGFVAPVSTELVTGSDQ
jgi:uncharacterized protein (TIGR03118 family)